MRELLDEKECSAAPYDGERIGVEPLAVVRQVAPAVGERADAEAALAPSPADAPMWGVAQRRVGRARSALSHGRGRTRDPTPGRKIARVKTSGRRARHLRRRRDGRAVPARPRSTW